MSTGAIRVWVFALALTACYVAGQSVLAGTPPLDSAAARRLPVIPEWAVHSPAPVVGPASGSMASVASGTCEEILFFDAYSEIAAAYFDSAGGITQMYSGDYSRYVIVRHDIDRWLNPTETVLPLTYGAPGLVADLDQDGNMELIVQRGDPGFGGNGYLDIHSMPSWDLRAHFTFPGDKVYMNPVAVNVDEDPFLELYIVPHGLSLEGTADIIKYFPATDSFGIQSEVPGGVGGTSAVADFDGDGRIEFISGHEAGYSLFEYANATLEYIEEIGAPYGGFTAAATHPIPGGKLFAVLGHVAGVYSYQIFEPVGDNEFMLVAAIEGSPGWSGVQRCLGTDVDCDGLDELALFLPPDTHVWEWNETTAQFEEQGCTWPTARLHAVDLDQNVVPEWGIVDYNAIFRAFRHECVSCLPPPSALLAWWPLDEATPGTEIDVWGGNHGSAVGNPVSVAGKVEIALNLDGSSEYVAVAPSVSLNLGSGDFSIDAWVRTTASPPYNPVLSHFDPVTQVGWAFWVDGGNSLGLRLADGTSSDFTSSTVPSLTDGAWHHVAVAVDRDNVGGVEFLADGEPVGTGDPTGTQGSLNNSADLFIGRWDRAASVTEYFAGDLDEVRLFGREIAPQEVRSVVAVDTLGNCRPEGVVCNCVYHGDVAGDDGMIDALDLTALVAHVFEGTVTPPQDPLCPHIDRGDLNCDSVENVLDIVRMIDRVYRGGDAPCNPCVANQ